MNQPEGDDLTKNSQLYYDLINSKSFFKNKGKGAAAKGRSGNMFSPGTTSDDGSLNQPAVVIEIIDLEAPAISFKCTDLELSIKDNIQLYVVNHVELFKQGKFSEFFTDKPPEKLDAKQVKRLEKVALFAKLSECHNIGNKICHASMMLNAFVDARSNTFNSMNDIPGMFDIITVHAKLLYQVLHTCVPS